MSDNSTSKSNSQFWNELCGSNVARGLGISELNSESLKKFDDWFFNFYPYLYTHLEPIVDQGERVVEVCLGFGSVASYLITRGVDYLGIDIAEGPTSIVNLRGEICGLTENSAVLADVLNLQQFESSEFGGAVEIGRAHV
mgnify:CR=1 FL=1